MDKKTTSDYEREIYTWQQVESVIRELAELELENEVEFQKLKKQAGILKQNYNDAILLNKTHMVYWRRKLLRFLKKHCNNGKSIRKKFGYGVLNYKNGKLKIKLYTAFARLRLGRS